MTPLEGDNLVRLVYLDEAGIDAGSPVMCVAGVLVHGDRQWPEVDRRILELVDKYVEPALRDGFIFHATDIYHGSGYFDRRKPEWSDFETQRLPVLLDLDKILRDLQLPVVFGRYAKQNFGDGILPTDLTAADRLKLMHQGAIADCLSQADRWLERWAPRELATAIHEDGVPAKPMIKRLVRHLRSEAGVSSMPEDLRQKFNFPLRRIIDTVHFAEKSDARPLQLADFCAFMLGRFFKEKPIPHHILVTLVAGSFLIEAVQKEVNVSPIWSSDVEGAG